MPIFYDESSRIFTLENKSVTYAFRVTEHGDLTHLYFGKRVPRASLSYLDQWAPVNYVVDYAGSAGRSYDTMPAEYPVFGTGDYREPALQLADETGSRLSCLRYARHRVHSVKPPLAGLPSLRGGETLEVTLADPVNGSEVSLFYTVYEDAPAVTRSAVVNNAGRERLNVLRAMSFSLDFPAADYDFITLCGAHARERGVVRERLTAGTVSVESKRGASSHQYNPFCALCAGSATELTGEAYGFNLIYSGSFRMSAERDQFGVCRVQGGINPFDFGWQLEGGERFTSPEAVLIYSDEGLSGMSRAFHDLYRAHLLPERWAHAPRPVVINNWEATYFEFDREKLFALIDAVAGTGVDTFVLDDGWFGDRSSDRSGLGDWTVNTQKLAGGLDAVIAHCRQKGLKFGLWFEPEMVSEDSDLYRAHPDWCLRDPRREPARGRNQLVLDMARQDVLQYVEDAVSGILSRHDISYVKWDMNRSMSEFCSSALPACRQQETAHRYILAVYELARRLTSRFPNVLFEGCSGGGGRFDPGMLVYFPQFWTSDNTDAYARTFIQYGTSMCYPLSAMTGHVSVCPNHQTGRSTSFETRGAIAGLCPTGYELDATKLTPAELDEVSRQIARYRRNEKLLLCGDLYRLESPFERGDFCWLIASKDKRRALCAYLRARAEANTGLHRLRLAGLDPEKEYRVDGLETPLSLPGATLMSAGIPLPPPPGDFSVVWLELQA